MDTETLLDEKCILFVCWGVGVAGNITHDIALLELNRSVPTKYVAQVAGSGAEKNFYDYRKNLNGSSPLTVHVGGYGVSCPGEKCAPSGRFLQGTVAMITHSECNGVFSNSPSNRNILCTRTWRGGQNICSGDSGSGLVWRSYKANKPLPGKGLLLAVASFSAKGCDTSKGYNYREKRGYAGFFHVRPYYPWIKKIITAKELQ